MYGIIFRYGMNEIVMQNMWRSVIILVNFINLIKFILAYLLRSTSLFSEILYLFIKILIEVFSQLLKN